MCVVVPPLIANECAAVPSPKVSSQLTIVPPALLQLPVKVTSSGDDPVSGIADNTAFGGAIKQVASGTHCSTASHPTGEHVLVWYLCVASQVPPPHSASAQLSQEQIVQLPMKQNGNRPPQFTILSS